MMGFKYNRDDFNRFKSSVENAEKNILQQAKMAVMDSLLDVQTTAKSPGYVPYKTGTLKRSITHKLSSSGKRIVGKVGTNVVYAAIQEFGGRAGRHGSVNIRPKYYLTRAVKDNMEKIKRRFIALAKIIKNK